MSKILYDNLKPLFSGAYTNYNDNRSKLFTRYLIKVNPISIVSGFNINNPNSTPENFNEMMEVTNYEENTKPHGSKDNDIHPEFYSFIVDVAKYHRALNFLKQNINVNKHQKNLYNFLQNFNNFDPVIQSFYRQILNLVDISNNTSLPIADIVGLANPSNFRINIKTRNNNVIVNNIIPRLGNWAGMVWINMTQTEVKHQDTYVTLYNNVYSADPLNTTLQEREDYVAPSKRINFSINLNNFFRSILGQEEKSTMIEPIFTNDLTDKYSRNKEEELTLNGKLVGPKSNYYKENAQLDNNCMTTGVKDSDGRTCQNYINDCLTGKNIDDCKTYFQSENFWDTTQAEIQQMLPGIAIDTLKKFGFEENKIYDETANRELVKVETLNSWLRRLSQLTNSETAKEIRNNIKFKGYLNNLISLINSNPSILNPTYSGLTNDNIKYNPNRFNNTTLGKFGIRAKYPNENTVFRDIDYLENSMKLNNMRLLNQSGGSLNTLATNMIDINKYTEKYPSYLFREMLTKFRIQLRHKKVDITDNDIKMIIGNIIDLSIHEEKLFNIIHIIEKYAELSNIFDNFKEVVSLDDMEKLIHTKKHIFEKKIKKEDKVLKLLKTIANQI